MEKIKMLINILRGRLVFINLQGCGVVVNSNLSKRELRRVSRLLFAQTHKNSENLKER